MSCQYSTPKDDIHAQVFSESGYLLGEILRWKLGDQISDVLVNLLAI